jgi:hypothetical protein
MKTRELDHAGARELDTHSPVQYCMRNDIGVFTIRDALIWACCASGKEGIRAEDMCRTEQ